MLLIHRAFLTVTATLLLCAAGSPARADDVPKGEVTKYTFDKSKIFPGTVRDYWVYVPKQYDPAKPACVYVNQDGVQYKAPEVFDQLIHKKEMPVVIGVFVMHGRVKAPSSQALDRFNRSFEYDGLGDGYVRFLLEELLPEVEKKTAADGRPITWVCDPMHGNTQTTALGVKTRYFEHICSEVEQAFDIHRESDKLRELYMSAGFTPQYPPEYAASQPPPQPAPAAAASAPPVGASKFVLSGGAGTAPTLSRTSFPVDKLRTTSSPSPSCGNNA